jgi:hypothetical protein
VARPEGGYAIENIETSAEDAAPAHSGPVVVDLGDREPASGPGGKRRFRKHRGTPRAPSSATAAAPAPSPPPAPVPSTPPAPPPVGSVKDGFTKLR